MNKILELFVEKLMKDRTRTPLVLAVGFVICSASFLHLLENDLSWLRTLTSPAFCFIATVTITTALLIVSIRIRNTNHIFKRLTVRIAIIFVGVAIALRSVSAIFYHREGIEIELLFLGKQELSVDMMTQSLQRFRPMLNPQCFDFRIRILTNDSVPEVADGFLDLDDVRTISHRYESRSWNHKKHFVQIFLVSTPFKQNFFTVSLPPRAAVVTTANLKTIGINHLEEYAFLNTFSWALANPASRAVQPIHDPHEDNGCLLDFMQQKVRMKSQLTSPQLCLSHREWMVSFYGESLVKEFEEIIKLKWLAKPQ